jgi:plastocyanin
VTASRPLAAFLTTAALALAACGGDDEASSTPTPADQPAGGGTKVTMKDIAFSPATLEVSVGDTVEWVNEDDVQHDAKADDGQFASELLDNGKTFEFTTKKAGSIHYVCTIHPGMEGTIEVTG